RQNWLLIVPHFMKHPSCYKIEKDMLSLIFLEAEQNYLEIERFARYCLLEKKTAFAGRFFPVH
ncbi:hypothetical protein, partial [Klebsiella pneumoniae]|uniref:hypothetical protein n=1 Tax=Klebsiella pneumoniae TaxID=573 RepID=UPI0025A19A47